MSTFFNNLLRPVIIISIIFISYFIYSCNSHVDLKPKDVPSDDNKTYIKIINDANYNVNVYAYEQRSDTNLNPTYFVPAKTETEKYESSPSILESGDLFFYEYLMPVGSITVPYYDFFQDNRKKIEKGVINTLIIPDLTSTSTNSSFLVIENDSNLIINVQGYQTPLPHSGQSFVEIQPGKSGVYTLKSTISSLSNHKIGPIGRSPREFPNSFNRPESIKPGGIYSFKYNFSSDNNSSVVLISESRFDISTKDKIWTIPTYTEPVLKGRFFTTGLLISRADVEANGYILTGNVHYEFDTVTKPHLGAIPYIGMVSDIGDITSERNIGKNLNPQPAGLNLKSFIEESNELIYFGQVYNEYGVGCPCILSTNITGTQDNYFYNKFVNDISINQELNSKKIVKWGFNSYAVICQLLETDRQLSQIYIAKINKNWNTITHQVFWISPEMDNSSFIDMVYDQTYNMLIILAETNTGSVIYFIDAADGSFKYPTVKQDYHNNELFIINGLFIVSQEYYVAGVYITKNISSYRGFITKIDINNGNVHTPPLLIDPQVKGFEDGGGGFRYILPENNGKTLILAGWCVRNRSNAESTYFRMPWLVQYALDKNNIADSEMNWEQIYQNKTEYSINSVHHNAIGSYLLEIYNEKTYHSYLISTDPLGNMSGDMKAPLPHSSNIYASQPGKPNIEMNISIDDAELETPATLNIPKGSSGTITIKGTWSSYQWYVNGLLITGAGSSYTFSTSSRNLGVYSITAVVTNSSGEKRSATCRVTVTNLEN